MTGSGAERWRRIGALLDGALQREPATRDAWLDAECGDDAALRDEVASLLGAHARSGAVDRLAADVANAAARLRERAATGDETVDGDAPGGPGPRGAAMRGRSVGRYEIVDRVGGGGMGVVYRALDPRLGRTVALKFLQPRFGADDSAAARFRLEARAVAALEHPNICTLYEIGETDDGQLFLAMPLYDGETLQRRIARGPLPVEEAAAIAVQILRGLAKAHARGIVHRDVKPSNVLVTDDGVVKILDFGIAKLADVTITAGGAPLGTAAYMSPEQAAMRPVDHRTDLWSLGAVLYEMLAGRRPFGSAGGAALVDGAPPPPLALARADVPPALEAVVRTALARAPDERWQTAQAFEQALAALGLVQDSGGLASGSGAARRTAGAPSARWRLRRALGGAALATLALAAVAVTLRSRGDGAAPDRARAASGSPATIAVLPFADGSPSRDQEYFSDGITDELIATLAGIDGLRVASRTSSFAFKGRGLDVRTVGQRLGVATVLEGSVRRAGARLRITAQLVSVADGYQLWAEAYDRDAGDAVAIQEEIARAIVQTLRVRLVGDSAASAGTRRPDATAYDLYLKGRYAWYRRSEAGLRAAVSSFERALAIAPDYARAHAGLADAYAVLGFYDYLAPTEAFPKAEAAARRAIALDATLAGPRATLGYVQLYHRWDLARGEEEFRRAIALEPNYSTAHQWYGNLLTAAGRFPEAEREIRRSQEIDPLSLIANAALGWVLYHAGDYAGAVAQCDRTLELNPDYALAHLWRGWALQAMDSLPAAVAAHRRALAASDSAGLYVASLARSLALAGDRAGAGSLLRRLLARGAARRYVPSYEVARVYVALGDRDAAFHWLDRALDERSHSMVFLRVDPQLAPLRADPRFARLVERVRPD